MALINILFLGIVSPLNNIEHVFFDVKSFFVFVLFVFVFVFFYQKILSCVIAILNRVAHLLMQMFPGIGAVPNKPAQALSGHRHCLRISCDIAAHCLPSYE